MTMSLLYFLLLLRLKTPLRQIAGRICARLLVSSTLAYLELDGVLEAVFAAVVRPSALVAPHRRALLPAPVAPPVRSLLVRERAPPPFTVLDLERREHRGDRAGDVDDRVGTLLSSFSIFELGSRGWLSRLALERAPTPWGPGVSLACESTVVSDEL